MGMIRNRLLGWLDRPTVLRRLALASVIANVVIVVTGGAVRLTGSGLGCPTWPSCTDSSLVPTKAYALHGIIEFTNRQLTFVLGVVAVLTLVAALRQHTERALAAWALGIIPAQAVVGGISVKTQLNPWVVSLHFLISIVIIAIALVLYARLAAWPAPAVPLNPVVGRLAQALVLAGAAVLIAGTVVTGAGPHPGDKNASGRVHRNGLNVASMSQLHADLVMVLVGLSLGMLALVYAVGAGRAVRRAVWILLAVEAAQAAIGYAQYFTGVPAGLVGLHMLGACLLWIAVIGVRLRVLGVHRGANSGPTAEEPRPVRRSRQGEEPPALRS
ncbi:COX15/CtaA family protein [Jatrophihabitans telluris]|uniref:COX15/CtaA family protein n=1 Tax=Jatrophihabitans telluris TaxID=2038343 RepID=A0ABY4R5E5_9ACTN|nr:COX15/CtaA family protein [Jatrophihabitans telluris]UQX90186.1 COX15/CtaA family protein [Jatrophihabitans telluris]